MKANEQTDAAMVPIVGDRRVTLPVVGRRVGNASPALEESNEDMLNPDQLTATFDYVLGQTNNQFTCNQFTTCDSTATEEGGKREEAFALLCWRWRTYNWNLRENYLPTKIMEDKTINYPSFLSMDGTSMMVLRSE
jgi:hypothetical protein